MATTVFAVNKEGTETTRVHLPSSAWGDLVLATMVRVGYTVQLTDQDPEPDTRGPDEKQRVEDIFDSIGV